MSDSMTQTSNSKQAALAQRSAQLEQLLSRLTGQLKLVPLAGWQWLLMLLLVIWLSHSIARIFWLLLPSPQIPPASLALVATKGPAGNSGGANINIDKLKSIATFGQAAVAAPTEEPDPQVATAGIENDATDTQLNLVLRGVLGSNDDSAARAVITSGDKSELYAIGDKLPVGNNVTLAKVLDVRVILSNNGKFESLWLHKDDPNAPKIASTYSAPPPVEKQKRSRVVGAGAYGGYPHPERQGAASSPPSSEGQRMADMSNTLADVVAMSIYREGGQVIGYKIRPGRNIEMFQSLGLQTDDIVTAVNGVPLTNPGEIMKIYKSMSSSTSANLEIKRGGSVINLDVVLN